MKAIIALALVAITVLARGPQPEELHSYTFDRYVVDFQKDYKDAAEKEMRKKLFAARHAGAMAHNAKGLTWTESVNQFSDRTDEEFKRLLGGRAGKMTKTREMLNAKPHNKKHKMLGNPNSLPKSLDYRNSIPSILTAVKNQGDCGSCWAHASTETVESHYAMRTGELYVLSQEQLNQCAPNPNDCGGTGGCDGSIAELAFDYIVAANGQAEEWTYPYTSFSGTTGTCKSKIKSAANITGYTAVSSNDQDAVMDALVRAGPLAINVAAMPWMGYKGGVFSGCDYSHNITIDHVVQLVGYGHDDGLKVDYWIVRNSWSPAWGEAGYIRLLRQKIAPCGYDNSPQDGTACKGSPDYLWVCGMCGMLFDTLYPNIGSQ